MISVMEGKPSHTTKSIRFIVSKDEWNTKEDNSKSLKNSLYVLPKGTSQAEVMSNCEKIE